jgi:Activator of Hsp90 ATPase homolog 1-like protein
MAAIEVDQFLAQPPDQVWRALTDPDLLGRWLMPNDFRPAAGHQFTFRTEPVLCFLAPPRGWRPALAHDGFDDSDLGQRMTMGILGGGWRGHLVKRLGELPGGAAG